MEYYVIKRGDTRPPLRYQCLNDDGSPANLTGATVRFKMRLAGAAASPKVNAVATIVDAPAGVVSYGSPWPTADTDTVGDYLAEFEATWSPTESETFPDDGFFAVLIGEDI